MLTAPQLKLLTFVADYTRQSGGVSPSFAEMMTALGYKSKAHVHHLLTQLEARGFIRRLSGKARAIEVLKLPNLNPPTIGE